MVYSLILYKDFATGVYMYISHDGVIQSETQWQKIHVLNCEVGY